MPILKIDKYDGFDDNGNAILIGSEEIEINLPPDFTQLRLQMLANSEYQRIVEECQNQRAVTRLENLVMNASDSINLDILKQFWDAVIDGLEVKPNEEAIASLNAIASTTNMLFSFNSNGYLDLF